MLYIVSTPIGNLKDITYRAVEVLNQVDFILCEDTRVTATLLNFYNISKQLLSFHAHNEHKKLNEIIKIIQNGKNIALVSDAGTPGISDPAFLLVRRCLQEKIKIICLPGATALIPAIIYSGFPIQPFVFEGFLPLKKGRNKKLQQIALENRTTILYESPHRLLKLLNEIIDYFGPLKMISISREISKIYEEILTDTAEKVLAYFSLHPPKGEFVVVIKGLE